MNRRFSFLAAAIAALALVSGRAQADEARHYPLNALYKDECGSCHVPYPPRLLSAASWKSIMAGLDRHFGSDASLEGAKAGEIASYLAAHAGRSERFAASGADPRVSATTWFKHEHRDGHDGLSAAVWKSPAVKSPANCAACHPKAADGDYEEDDIRIPRSK